MIDPKKSGYLVTTKDGKMGRTIHGKGLINGKVPVYLASKTIKIEEGVEFATEFEENAILCDPTTVKQIGFID